MPPKAAILSPDLHQMAKLVLLVSIPRGSAVARQSFTLAQNLDASTLTAGAAVSYGLPQLKLTHHLSFPGARKPLRCVFQRRLALLHPYALLRARRLRDGPKDER